MVPRTWTHLIGTAAGHPIPPSTALPETWRELSAGRGGLELEEMPTTMGDSADVWWRSWEVGYDPSDAVDQTIMATRKEIFPYHGLDPWFD